MRERELYECVFLSKQQIVGRHLTGLGPRRSKEISDELNLQAFNLCGVLFKMAIINTQPQQAFGLHQEIVGALGNSAIFQAATGDLSDMPSV